MRNFLFLIPLALILISYQNCGNFESYQQTDFSKLDRPDLDVSAEPPGVSTPNDKDEPAADPMPKNSILKFANYSIAELTSDEVRISFTVSDYVQAFIEYGETAKLGTKSQAELSYNHKAHNQTITGLKPNTKYYYSIAVKDRDGNIAPFEIQSFTTAKGVADPVDPIPTPSDPTPGDDNGEKGQASANSVCGNNKREPTEQCDDGNLTNGDGCSMMCSIESPKNPNAFYVSVNGSDSNSGKSEGSAFKTINRGVSALSAGYTLYVKAGNYGGQSVHISKSGSANAPITIEGYKQTPGDNPRIVNFGYNSKHDSNVMPLFDGGSRTNKGTAIKATGSYVHIKNLQVTRFHGGAGLQGSYGILDNIIISAAGNPAEIYSGSGFWLYNSNNQLKNSIIVDAGSQAVTIFGSNNKAEFNKVYGSARADGNGTDYYFIVGGYGPPGSKVNDNIIRNNYMERVGSGSGLHSGHGFTVKAQGERNLFENNTIVNMDGGCLSARHSKVQNNIYRNNYCYKGTGIAVSNGASTNLFENNTMEQTIYGIVFYTGTEDVINNARAQPVSGENNSFKNIFIKNSTRAAISFRNYSNNYKGIARNNIFDSLRIEGGSSALFQIGHKNSNNLIKNSSIKNINKFEILEGGFKKTDLNIKFENTTCTGCAFTLP